MENHLLAVSAGIRGDKSKLKWIIAVDNVKKAELSLKTAQINLQLTKAQLIIADCKYDRNIKFYPCTQSVTVQKFK